MADAGYFNFEADHRTLSASTDTTVTFSRISALVRVLNWDTTNPVLVKNGVIASDSDSTASRVGVAPAANVPNARWFPVHTLSIHLRSAGASVVTVENYF